LPFPSPTPRSPLNAHVRLSLATKAVAAAPHNANLWLELASAQAELENWAAATEVAREAVRRGSNAAEARLKLAQIKTRISAGLNRDSLAGLDS
jgi:hypothetical protein